MRVMCVCVCVCVSVSVSVSVNACDVFVYVCDSECEGLQLMTVASHVEES